VPVAFEVAVALRAPLDVLLVRKLGVPSHGELALGAIANGGIRFINNQVVRDLRITSETIDAIAARELREAERQAAIYRGNRPPPKIEGQTVILIDDGLATGATMRAAVAAIRRQKPARLIVGVPVGASRACAALKRKADALVCVQTPQHFVAVGEWYEDFSPTSDAEVTELLRQGWRAAAVSSGATAQD
jgi:predicted phosphoribosyltransferase